MLFTSSCWGALPWVSQVSFAFLAPKTLIPFLFLELQNKAKVKDITQLSEEVKLIAPKDNLIVPRGFSNS